MQNKCEMDGHCDYKFKHLLGECFTLGNCCKVKSKDHGKYEEWIYYDPVKKLCKGKYIIFKKERNWSGHK